MATSDWNSVKFDHCRGKCVNLQVEDCDIDVSFGEYALKFNTFPECCVDCGVRFFHYRDTLTVFRREMDLDIQEKIEGIFSNIIKCKFLYVKEPNSFRIYFGDFRGIEFFNDHNGYYPHDFYIYKSGKLIFSSSL